MRIISRKFFLISRPRPCVRMIVRIFFVDLEEEEGKGVADEGGGHVHCPEDARVASDCCWVRVVR